MPELPEVETVVRDLRAPLVGRAIASVLVGDKKLRRSPGANLEALVGRTFHGIERRGKWICLDLAGPWLLVHLGMTGQFTFAAAQLPREDHTHVVFTLGPGGEELRFRDIRRFGSVSLYATRADLDAFFVKQLLGPEPWDLEPASWFKRLKATSRVLKAILLDQRTVAGVGNIYADESLHVAGLHPALPGKDVTRAQAEKLRLAIVEVLEHAIELRGSSIRNYVGGSGLMGKMQNEFRVYGRTGEPCLRCTQPLERIVLAGRSTHFCPRCQRLAKRRSTH